MPSAGMPKPSALVDGEHDQADDPHCQPRCQANTEPENLVEGDQRRRQDREAAGKAQDRALEQVAAG